MEHYTFLREFADSWGLVAMFLFFCGAILILFRPGSSKLHADAANIPLRDDTINRRDQNRDNSTATKTTLEVEDAT